MSTVHRCPPDPLPVQMKIMPIAVTGLPTPIERNLNLLSSFTARCKCRPAISISWWKSGHCMALNTAKSRPFSVTATFMKPSTPPPLVMSLGNPSSPVTLMKYLSKVKSLRGWRLNTPSGFATHASSFTIYYQTRTSKICSTRHLTRNTMQKITTDTMTSCQAIGHGDMRYVFVLSMFW